MPAPDATLSPRQLQILSLIAAGYRSGDGAQTLGISPHTWRTDVGTVLRKLGVHTQAHAVAIAVRRGWV